MSVNNNSLDAKMFVNGVMKNMNKEKYFFLLVTSQKIRNKLLLLVHYLRHNDYSCDASFTNEQNYSGFVIT